MFPDRPVTIPNDPHNMGYQITSDPMWAFNSPQNIAPSHQRITPEAIDAHLQERGRLPMQEGLSGYWGSPAWKMGIDSVNQHQLSLGNPASYGPDYKPTFDPSVPGFQPQMQPPPPPQSFGPNQQLAMQMGGYPGPSGIRPQMQMQTGGAGIGGGYDGASTDRGLDGRSPVMNPNFLHNEGGRLGGGGGGGLATNQSWMDSALGNATGYGPSGSLDLSGMGSTIKDALSSGQWGDALKGAGQGLMLTGNPLVALATGVYKYFKGDKTDPGHSYTPAQTFPYPPPDDGEGGGDTGSSPHSMRQPIPITRRRRPGTSSR